MKDEGCPKPPPSQSRKQKPESRNAPKARYLGRTCRVAARCEPLSGQLKAAFPAWIEGVILAHAAFALGRV